MAVAKFVTNFQNRLSRSRKVPTLTYCDAGSIAPIVSKIGQPRQGGMMRRFHRVALIALAALTVAAGPTFSQNGTTASAASRITDAEATKIAVAAAKEGAVGSFIDRTNTSMVVRKPTSGRGASLNERSFGKLAGIAGRPTVSIVESKYTTIEIDIMNEMLMRIHATSSFANSDMNFGYDPINDTFDLNTNAPADAFREVASTFGDKLTIYHIGGASRAASRGADGSPFKGGAKIKGSGTAYCSSGFAVKTPAGHEFMVTAAHCFPMGQAIKTAGGVAAGTVSRYGPFPEWDLEFYDGKNYSGTFYVDGAGSSTTADMIGQGEPVVGSIVCFSGATSGEKCGGYVDGVSQTFCDGSGCTPNLFTFHTAVVALGDSGSPVYVGDVGLGFGYAKGIAIAYGPKLGQPHTFAHKLSTVVGHFGAVSVVTSP